MSNFINTRNRKIAFKLALLMGAVLMLVGPSDPGYSDDTFLFRVQSGKPYLQIMFDTSSSMNLSAQMGGVAVASSGDSPLSTFYQAKSAVFEVFDNAHRTAGDFVHYGFYSYNQDGLRVRGKHWLYQVQASGVMLGTTPYAEPGEVLVFGAHLPDDGNARRGRSLHGSCNARSARQLPAAGRPGYRGGRNPPIPKAPSAGQRG